MNVLSGMLYILIMSVNVFIALRTAAVLQAAITGSLYKMETDWLHGIKRFLYDAAADRRVIYISCMAAGLVSVVAATMALPLLPGFLLGFAGAGIPLMVRDIAVRCRENKIRDRLPDFISILSRWCSVKEDIIYALEKSVDSGIGEPLRTYVNEACIGIKSGLPVEDALNLLRDRVRNIYFRDLMLNIIQTVKSRGDIKGLLLRMENQYYRVRAELDRRNIRTFKDRILVYVMMCFVPPAGAWLICFNGSVRNFYLNSGTGNIILTVLILFYLAGILFSLKITGGEV